jgi:hypothetical protein
MVPKDFKVGFDFTDPILPQNGVRDVTQMSHDAFSGMLASVDCDHLRSHFACCPTLQTRLQEGRNEHIAKWRAFWLTLKACLRIPRLW